MGADTVTTATNSTSPASTVGADRVPSVFISYRRDESLPTASAMARHLREDLSSVCVFRDEDDLIGGQDWRRALETAMASADAAIVLAGRDWAGGARPGERRIDDVEDPVREEVRQALSPSTRVRAIPVLLDGASPAPNVPDDIAELTPSALLQARYEIVPYVDATGLLADTLAWCRGTEAYAEAPKVSAGRLLGLSLQTH